MGDGDGDGDGHSSFMVHGPWRMVMAKTMGMEMAGMGKIW